MRAGAPPTQHHEPGPVRGQRLARPFGWAVVLSCVLAAPPARAAEADGATAEVLFREGKALLDAGDTTGACAKLEASWQLEQAPGTLLNLAMCHRRQGRTATAWAELLRAGDMSQAAGNKARAAGARRIAAELEPSLSRLVLHIASPRADGLAVTIDERVLPAAALDTPLPLDPGRHELVVRAPGHRSWRGEFVMGAGDRNHELLVPALAPDDGSKAGDPTGEPHGAGSWLTPFGWIALGLGGAGLVVGGVLGGEALGLVSDAEQDPALCPAKRCTPAGREQLDSAEGLGNGSTAALAVGGILVVMGAVALLSELASSDARGPDAGEPAATLVVGPVAGDHGLFVGLCGPF